MLCVISKLRLEEVLADIYGDSLPMVDQSILNAKKNAVVALQNMTSLVRSEQYEQAAAAQGDLTAALTKLLSAATTPAAPEPKPTSRIRTKAERKSGGTPDAATTAEE